MQSILDINLTGSGSLLDWGLWILLVLLGALVVRIYVRRWMSDERLKLRRSDPEDRDAGQSRSDDANQ